MTRPTLKLFDGFAHTSPNLNADVQELQTLLKKHGYQVAVNGQYGVHTQKAVAQFQVQNKLTSTGIADQFTWARLLQAPAPTGNYIFQTTYASKDASLLKQLTALNTNYIGFVKEVATKYNLPVAVIAGIGSRESAWGLALTPPGPGGTGDGGHGRGLIQIDDRWHVDFINSGKWSDARENLIYGGALLRSFINYLVTKQGWTEGYTALQAAVAAYNCGPRRVTEAFAAGLDIDYYTTGRNYSKDTLNRAGWFQINGVTVA